MELLEGENGDVYKLISTLKELSEKKSPLLNTISNFPLLIQALTELNNMIELYDVKKSIVEQVKFLLVNTVFDEQKSNFDGHMLHTVLAGGSGCGKTAVGIILAKIWTSLGLLKKKEIKLNIPIPIPIEEKNLNDTESESEEFDTNLERVQELEKQIQNMNSSNKIKNNVVKNLQNYCANLKEKLKNNNLVAKNNLFTVKTLRRELEKLLSQKDFSYNQCLHLLNEIIKNCSQIIQKNEEIISSSISEETVNFTINIPNINNEQNKNKEIREKTFDAILSEIKNRESNPITPIINPNTLQTLQNFFQNAVNNTINNPVMSEIEPKHFDLIRIVSREDFVGGFLGQTAMKTEKLLRDSLGKVLFIDEAYSLINDDKDSYGYECLSTLNRFMSEHSDEIVIIFAGYKEMLETTIFKAQPGLKRRCTWNFEIKGYSEVGLAKIFKKQLANNGWALCDNVDIVGFFKENLRDFPHYGGTTLQLTFYCKIAYAAFVFDKGYANEKIISKEILYEAFKYLKTTKPEEDMSYKKMFL
jgi:hypothetical protein